MRPIDADALLKKHCTERAKGNCKRCDWYGDSHCSTEIFGTQIDFAPTIEAEPVKHGRWETYFYGKELMCSVCKATFWDENGNGGSNYCPNCGCKMDLEDVR